MDTTEDVEVNPTNSFHFGLSDQLRFQEKKESINGTIIYIDEKRRLFYVKEFFFSQ